MRKIVALIFVLIFGFLVFTSLYSVDGLGQAFPKYGDAKIEDRVSSGFIDKNVTGENDRVVFGESKNLETGSANYITSIIVNYRSFDTLGEVTVLFVSALGISLLLGTASDRMKFVYKPNFILKYGAKIVFGIILITGAYVFVHGHLTPGGGFPGGGIIAAAILLLYISDDKFKSAIRNFKILEGTAGSLYVIIGLVGMVISGYFLINFLPTGTVGEIFSAGIIPIVYILIGLKVGAELTGIITDFVSEEADA